MDRMGETNINNFGSKMVIVEYRGCMDIDVYFPQYNWIAKSTRYDVFKNGKYQVNCNLINPKIGKSKGKYLGRYETEIEAFEVYKYYKEKNIKEVANFYKN